MPQAIPFITLALAAAGTGVAVHGQMEQAKAAERAGKYNQKVNEANAAAAQNAASYEAEQVRRRNRIILGRQKAAIAKAGILDTGSAEDLFFDSAVQGELDVLATKYQGQVQSNYYRSRGNLARMEGDAAATASRYRAVGTLLTGAGQTASSYNSYRRSSGSGPTFED